MTDVKVEIALADEIGEVREDVGSRRISSESTPPLVRVPQNDSPSHTLRLARLLGRPRSGTLAAVAPPCWCPFSLPVERGFAESHEGWRLSGGPFNHFTKLAGGNCGRLVRTLTAQPRLQ